MFEPKKSKQVNSKNFVSFFTLTLGLLGAFVQFTYIVQHDGTCKFGFCFEVSVICSKKVIYHNVIRGKRCEPLKNRVNKDIAYCILCFIF